MIRFKGVHYKYRNSHQQQSSVLNDISLDIPRGEVVVVAGESGCGKSTLVRLINGLCPQFYEGELKGFVYVDGKEPAKEELYETSRKVGSVFQNPRTQFFNVDTTSEITFACENQGMEKQEILKRFHSVIEELGLKKLLDRNIFELSGGEKQKIACASIAMMDSEVVVMDEPSSNLDLHGIEELRGVIEKWKKEKKTVIIAEHRLYYLRELADRLLFMKDGILERSIDKEGIKNITAGELKQIGLRTFSVKELFEQRICPKIHGSSQADAYVIEHMEYRYGRSKRGVSVSNLNIEKGRIIALVGFNGAGKSTFAKCLCGLKKACKDRIFAGDKRLGKKARIEESFLVMQDVNTQLFADSVINEVLLSLREKYGKAFDPKLHRNEAMEILKMMDLADYCDRHPISLSGGQKQRVAIAGAIAADKQLMILDEPTSGLDYKHMVEVGNVLQTLADMGKAVVVITHDMELILSVADRIVALKDGKVTDEYELNDQNKRKLYSFFTA